jgi:hypothetical protein
MTASRYGDPQALRQALSDRLRRLAAGRPGVQLSDLHRQFAYDRLLCRVFSDDPDRWVLKGAVAMLARLEGVSRHSLDVDLLYSRADDLREAEDALRSAAARDMGDQFRFTIGPGRLIAQAGRTLRVPVVAFVGASEFASFRVDLVAGLTMTGVPEQVPPIVPIDLPGLLRTPYRAYPVVDHIADKVCALLEVHQRSGGSAIASTRYRDLLDLVVFAQTASVDAQSLATALHSEALRRGLALPDRLTKPRGSGWPAGYARVARETPQLAERDLDAALVTAGRLIDPVLMGDIAGRWDPGALAWR